MSWRWDRTPAEPGWTIDWPAIRQRVPGIQELDQCPQDSDWHGEGDVGTHTRMVCESLVSDARWRESSEPDRSVLFVAALLHDIEKPRFTCEENGRVVSPGHAQAGAKRVRHLLWHLDENVFDSPPLVVRESIAQIVRYHGFPLWAINRENPARAIASVSQVVRCDWLALVAEADVRGRVCTDQLSLFEQIELFRELASEENCSNCPRSFASDHARVLYFRDRWDTPDLVPHHDPTCCVTLMSGLPGSGKDTWIARHASEQPVVSLDTIRKQLRVRPEDNQGKVIQLGREEARSLLRDGRDFVWNATNTTHHIRGGLVNLFLDYGAHVRIVYLEEPLAELSRRNKKRTNPVPQSVLEKLIGKLDVPDLREAHRVDWA